MFKICKILNSKFSKDISEMSAIWPGLGGPTVNYISSPPDDEYCRRQPRKLCILGSTGSIGRNALLTLDKDYFVIRSLAGGKNATLLAKQAEIYRPAFLAMADKDSATLLAKLLPSDYAPVILYGEEGFAQLASDMETDLVLSAQMGVSGLHGTIAAALSGKTIALANKESLVLAGGLLRQICLSCGASILPVDSEHYAFFQCIAGRGQEPEQFILTASGGPFRQKAASELKYVTPEMALAHPNWQMGKKISIDSATLMNKGLEFIETVMLYGVPVNNITVLVHPQSIIHSLARFKDNSLLAQLAVPDMKLPIASCLYWPDILASAIEPLDLLSSGSFSFEKPDEDKFICLRLAREACAYEACHEWKHFGLNPACIVLGAANEAAVESFLSGKCSFCDIGLIVERALQKLVYENTVAVPSICEGNMKDIAQNAIGLIRKLERQAFDFVSSEIDI